MDTQHRVDISILNDCYGELLTKHQSEMIRLYYDADVSLNEIADEYSISRQAVRDAIQRGERALEDYEAKLHMIEDGDKLTKGLEELLHLLDDEKLKDKVRGLIDIVEGE